MSSVKGSDSSNANREQDVTVARKKSETKQNGESDLARRHNLEIRRLNELHYGEIEKIKDAHKVQMDNLRRSTSADVTERDHKYQQEIEELRTMYRKNLQTQADDTSKATEQLRKSATNEIEQQKAHKEARVEQLSGDFEKGIKERESTYNKSMSDAREQQQEAIGQNRDKLQAKHDQDMALLRNERNRTVGNLQKSFDDYRSNADSKFRDQELRHFQGQARASDNLIHAVGKERENAQDTEEYLREGFKDGLGKTRERFEKRMNEERKIAAMNRDDLRSDVGSRIDDQITRLERENRDLKDGGSRGELKLKQENERHLNNMMEAYQRNVDNYKEQKDAAVRQSNDSNHKDISKIRREYDEQVTNTNRLHRLMDEERNGINKQAIDGLNRDYKMRNELTKSVADKRVKELYDSTTEEKTRLTEMQIDNHTASQRSHQDTIKQIRTAMEQEKIAAVTTLQEQLQKQELNHNQRMEQLSSKYEKTISGLKDELVKQKKFSDENLKRVTEDMQRQNKLAMDQVDQQNRDRMRQVGTQHAEELRTINKRNEAKVDQILNEVKKT